LEKNILSELLTINGGGGTVSFGFRQALAPEWTLGRRGQVVLHTDAEEWRKWVGGLGCSKGGKPGRGGTGGLNRRGQDGDGARPAVWWHEARVPCGVQRPAIRIDGPRGG
jgi:hypothetical protein